MNVEFRVVGSLEKVRPRVDPPALTDAARDMTALRGDCFSFQIAYRALERVRTGEETLFFGVTPADGLTIDLYRVAFAPVRVPGPADADEDYLMTEPGLMPDRLDAYDPRGGAFPVFGQWRSVWASVRVAPDAAAGRRELRITCDDEAGERLFCDTLAVDVLDAALPEQQLIFTQWFHADCLADYYRVAPFSEAHWAIVERFAALAVQNGVNMLLTPVFTPPLDTYVGGERTTVQLVDVFEEDGGYRFAFDKLDRWIDLCAKIGVRYLEICPLFTQWGAKAAPKIIVIRNGAPVRAFGWDTPATGASYQSFLAAFLPALKTRLEERGWLDRTYFHISDEPSPARMESYRAARNSVLPLLEGCKVIDALSSFDLYLEGLAPKPVVATNHIEPFLAARVPGLWAYYCCAQGRDVSNRFIAMPSARNRILGVQLYLFDIEGFLQWGYNFYNSRLSYHAINPFADTDAEDAFPSGDAFSVYPGADGAPIPSLRLVVFKEALDDLRALRLLESLRGRGFVTDLIRREASMDMTFSRYPRQSDFLYRLRRCIHEEIAR